MTVVLDRPYEFVPPHRGDWWPSFIQTFRLVDRYLRHKEGVVEHECRNLHYWKESLERGDGILLTPNHCRYADPLVLGWPARELNTHLYAMASWHLFNKGKFDGFAIQKMGGFSINREGTDRQSLEAAIGMLATAERPLILFPEGTTNRTNDVLKPLLDGVSLVARTASRRRKKSTGGQVVMHPIAIKYLCVGNIADWADRQLIRIEDRLGWESPTDRSVLQRTVRLSEALLALKEIEYLGASCQGSLPARRDRLIEQLLQRAEQRLLVPPEDEGVRGRVRAVRAEVASRYFRPDVSEKEQRSLRIDVAAADLAQDLMSYPNCYLQADQTTDTRIVETIQRMQESLFGKADVSVPLRVVIECDKAIVVPPAKAPRGEPDPLLEQVRQRLGEMLARLSREARPVVAAGLA